MLDFGLANPVTQPKTRRPGSVIAVYATGGGQTDPPSTTGSVNPCDPLPLLNPVGQPTVIFAGASPGDLTGMLRLNIRTPAVTGDAVPIRIAITGVSSWQRVGHARH